jgi:beta-mannosidase
LKKNLLLLFIYTLLPLLAFNQSFEKNLSKEKWQFKNTKETEWLKAKVPGTFHTDLLNLKKIPDPYLANNESALQYLENENWDYKTNFIITTAELDNEHIDLQFDGLDTYAKVFVNDSLVLEANNMFRTWIIDIKKGLHVGKNTIYIQFESAVNKAKLEVAKLPYTLPGDEKVFVRKAQYQFGWDWGPRFVTCGIGKDVKLKFWNQAKINNIQFIQKSLTSTKAFVEFKLQIKSSLDDIFQIKVLDNNAVKVFDMNVNLQSGSNSIKLAIEIKDPKLWWTHNLGEQNLYNYAFKLTNSKRFVDSASVTFGLRTIELMQEKDSIGQSFYFKLNGVPIFAKGANYIPEDNFLPRVNLAKTKELIKNAKASNINMLRVWGGGVYGSNDFYKLCNQNGILVWQDFMFACAMYPANNEFLANVSAEINDQIVRLRNNPCLAIWCGNNEIDEGWKNWGWQKQFNYSTADSTKIAEQYKNLFEIVIKNAVYHLDNSRSYWPSSPSIGWGRKESLTQGDAHYWGVWWGMEPFKMYQNKVGRFMSEYGFQGMPSVQTFKNMGALQLKDGENVLDSTVLKTHQKHPTGYKTIQTYMERDYLAPKTFENYVYVSQLLQAEGMKTAIEAHRRAMPYCMGSLYWQLNDCWPVTSWSSVDYNGDWKALHYQVKQSFSDLLISFQDKGDSVLVFFVSDKMVNIKGDLSVNIFDFDGKTIFSDTIQTIVKSNTSSIYYYFDKSKLKGEFNLNSLVLSASFKNENTTISALHFFVKPKDLILQKPTIYFKYLNKNQIEISSDKLAKNVFLRTDNKSYQFEDNYFDLLPNEKKIIHISGKYSKTDFFNTWAKSLFDAK